MSVHPFTRSGRVVGHIERPVAVVKALRDAGHDFPIGDFGCLVLGAGPIAAGFAAAGAAAIHALIVPEIARRIEIGKRFHHGAAAAIGTNADPR